MTHLLPEPSPLLWWGFVALSLAMAGVLVAAVTATSGRWVGAKAAALVALWLAATGGLAAGGWLDHWVPPRMTLVLGGVFGVLIWASRAPWGARLGALPLGLLVGVQVFRIPVELLLHEAVEQGIASPTLTWTGTNFDMISGLSAAALAPFATRLPPRALQAWNVGCAAILAVTVGTALLAMPTPLRQIGGEPANVWVADFPFVWLPGVLVLCAWLGHVALWRRLRSPAEVREALGRFPADGGP